VLKVLVVAAPQLATARPPCASWGWRCWLWVTHHPQEERPCRPESKWEADAEARAQPPRPKLRVLEAFETQVTELLGEHE